jgi:GNAT superfamily N-acetyltransferase
MMSDTVSSAVCRPARLEDMGACAAILNRWIDDTPWMPRLHERAAVERHYRETIFGERDIYISELEGAVAGFIALSSDHHVTALYLDRPMRGKGCGKALLDLAKQKHPGGLQLWTFEANADARRFYAREGFSEIRRSDGDNEEGLPDVLLQWRTPR